MSLRTALRVAYVGWRFHGFVRQPKVRTVQGVLEEALEGAACADGPVRLKPSSRTDRGVSALDNVVAFQGRAACDLRRLNSLLPRDVVAWARGNLEEGRRLRDACRFKTYVYFLPGTWDAGRLEEGLDAALSLGPERLCRGGDGKTTLGSVEVGVEDLDWGILVRVSGERFCWEMVRRLVGTAENYVRLGRPVVAAAPARGLVLVETKCDLEMEIHRELLLRFLGRWDGEARGWGAGLLLYSLALGVTSSRL